MAIKELFSNNVLPISSLDDVGQEIESADYVKVSVEEKNIVIPHVDYSVPKNFCKWGSAEAYYADSIDYILTTYPYDGSLKEKLEWEISSSHLDKFIFEKEYPRTNGYINLGVNYGALLSSSVNYDLYGNNNYIFFKGGPNTASSGMVGVPLYQTFGNSNYYSTGSRRESNLEINGNTGLTVEFWLKKSSFISGSESSKQVICDIWNSSSISNSSYGRFRVEIRPGVSGQDRQFYIELSSGSLGISSGSLDRTIAIGQGLNITGSSWNHYAISVVNTGSAMIAQLYCSGTLNHSVVTGSSIGVVTGSMIGTLGSLITTTLTGTQALGYAKLSGSLDEFRFWKSRRNAKQIGRYWFTQVGAGTNTDESNTNLGVYFKFNEGIINTGSIHPLDCKVLDYSGRISNGNWIGYVTGSRNTGSAITEANVASSEFLDPIIYTEHSGVVALKQRKQEIGYAHDSTNSAFLYGTIPEWITKEDKENGKGVLLKITQAMCSFLDNVHLQIEALPNIKNTTYVSSSFKPYPFVSRFLESAGLISPEIFSDVGALQSLASRDDKREYQTKLVDVKNRLYQNVYNNLVYIFKSKGTEKSFRNLIRCFGVDDELIRLNLYGDNVTYKLQDNVKYGVSRKKFADFNNVDRFDCTVYQHTSSNPASRSFISGPANMIYLGNTYEAEVIFPKKFEKDSELYFHTPFLTSSLFGCHTSDCSESVDKTWPSVDSSNFQVLAIKTYEESKDCFFMLTGTVGYMLTKLTSSVFKDVYDNQKWNFAVKIKPSTYPFAPGTTGSANNNFDVEFVGYNTIMDIVNNSFIVTGTISSQNGSAFMYGAKRFFVGAHRTNFTGSVLQYSDVKISSLRVWLKYLENEVIMAHSRDPSNYGSLHPSRNAYVTEISRSFGSGL